MSAIKSSKPSAQRRLIMLLAGLFNVAGFAWLFWVWATVKHEPMELITYGWPTPVLLLLGVLLATDGAKQIGKPV